MMEHCPVCDKGRRALLYCKRAAENCGLRGGGVVKIEGEVAKEHVAVRLDSYMNAHDGELVSADDETGRVVWKDKTGTQREVTLGAHAIRIRRQR